MPFSLSCIRVWAVHFTEILSSSKNIVGGENNMKKRASLMFQEQVLVSFLIFTKFFYSLLLKLFFYSTGLCLFALCVSRRMCS